MICIFDNLRKYEEFPADEKSEMKKAAVEEQNAERLDVEWIDE